MRIRLVFKLLLLMVLVQSLLWSHGVAQSSGGIAAPDSASREAPVTNDSLWIAGSSFKPWATTIPYNYYTNGCIVSGVAGSMSTPSFTASLRVPDASIVRGLEFFFYDTSSSNSQITLTSYNGQSAGVDHVTVASKGNGGYGSTVVALGEPYTVNTYQRSLVINWFPTVAGESMRLCGARLIYDSGPATGPLDTDYFFQAGVAFKNLDSRVKYGSTTAGCMYVSSPGQLMLDLDIPDGSTVEGVYFLYFNAFPLNFNFYLYDFDGLGASRLLASANSNNGSSTGYGFIFKGGHGHKRDGAVCG